ncbi:hypothetical protein Ahia01_001100000 [Argonauta hians]
MVEMRINKRLTLLFVVVSVVLCCIIVYNHIPLASQVPLLRFKSKENLNVPFIFAVKSSPENAELRKSVRETWATYIGKETKSFIMFYTCWSSDADVNARVRREAAHYQDIYQSSVLDTTANQSRCTLDLLSHLSKSYGTIKYLFKMKDSTFLNVPYLIRTLKSNKNLLHNFIMGVITRDTKADRDKSSPWFLSKETYPQDLLPTYVQSFAYMMSGELIPRIIETAKRTPYVWIEDVYITGILPRNMSVNYIDSLKFGIPGDICKYREYIAIMNCNTPTDMKRAFVAIEVPEKRCT